MVLGDGCRESKTKVAVVTSIVLDHCVAEPFHVVLVGSPPRLLFLE